jgi:8-oxoguanine deaminase
MKTLLIRDADVVVTMDDQRRELARASVLVRGRAVEAIGPAEDLPREADEVIDARA